MRARETQLSAILWSRGLFLLCVRVRILGVLKIVCAEQVKPDCCRTPAVVSILLTQLPVSCPSTSPPLHYILNFFLQPWQVDNEHLPA